jgi:hypothetical protein
MVTDADDNFWPQCNGASAMTTSIIPHKFGYGRVARKRRAIPKILDNRQNSARMASNPLKIGRMLRQPRQTWKKQRPMPVSRYEGTHLGDVGLQE